MVVNKKFWDGLPADIRDQLEKAMKEATAFGNGQSAKENDDALEAIKKAGKTEIITLTPEQDAAMRKAMEPVYKDVASRVGQPLIDEFMKETGGVDPLSKMRAARLTQTLFDVGPRHRMRRKATHDRSCSGRDEGKRCCCVSSTGSRKS